VSIPHYQRILLKLSGEALKGDQPFGVDPKVLGYLFNEINEVHLLGVKVGIVIGGGNYFRGAQVDWMKRSSADQVGMMATIMNGLTLFEFFREKGLPCALFSALSVEGVVGYSQEQVLQALEEGKVVIFAGGTGHPFFSTDTAAALRAREIDAQALIKATQVDGVYSADPRKDPDARFHAKLDYLHILRNDLRVMDATSVSFCREYRIPILVFDVSCSGHLKRAVLGEPVGTLISEPIVTEEEA
jgi:uridylate kinase